MSFLYLLQYCGIVYKAWCPSLSNSIMRWLWCSIVTILFVISSYIAGWSLKVFWFGNSSSPFHNSCITLGSLQHHKHCPLCRYNLGPCVFLCVRKWYTLYISVYLFLLQFLNVHVHFFFTVFTHSRYIYIWHGVFKVHYDLTMYITVAMAWTLSILLGIKCKQCIDI